MCLQVASCERTCLPTGQAATKIKSILKEQDKAESAMRVTRLGSRTGSRPVRKSFGVLCCKQLQYAVLMVGDVLTMSHLLSFADLCVLNLLIDMYAGQGHWFCLTPLHRSKLQ